MALALVTGGNRGIGLEACRQLAERGAQVIMGVRDLAKGQAAKASLGALAARVTVEQVAVDDAASVTGLAQRLGRAPGRLDVLINNAGVFDKRDAAASAVATEVVEHTFRTNVLGPMRMIQALLLLLRSSKSARIINLSSGMGALSDMAAGYAAYRMSKTALNALTATLASELATHRIAVNSMCPGWVKTDMGGPGATRSVGEGADTAVWLALEADQTLSGKFWRDRAEIPW
ncbi:MAG: SDR family NAD(P)-dependent oxidoreductase [Planctomycetes bacterium]|nr:SDR family NAD(P)-dependent oxidoreductase [Planctomycetota bacterium]